MFDEYSFPPDAYPNSAEPILETYVYCSRAAASVDDVEVSRIIEYAQRHNAARGITGVLVFGSGIFFQWIEGPPIEVARLIANLHGDARHCDIVPLDRNVEQRERLYPSWEMEQVRAEDIREVLQEALGSAEDEANILALRRILEHLEAGALVSLRTTQSGRDL